MTIVFTSTFHKVCRGCQIYGETPQTPNDGRVAASVVSPASRRSGTIARINTVAMTKTTAWYSTETRYGTGATRQALAGSDQGVEETIDTVVTTTTREGEIEGIAIGTIVVEIDGSTGKAAGHCTCHIVF